jgi:hypothetical protein
MMTTLALPEGGTVKVTRRLAVSIAVMASSAVVAFVTAAAGS